MFKFKWPFRKKVISRSIEAAHDKVKLVPQYDALDPLSRVVGINPWDVETKEPFKLVGHEQYMEHNLFPAAKSAMDGAVSVMDDDNGPIPSAKAANSAYTVPEQLADWYNSQGFIGYQSCAIIAQHWLVDKACSMSGDDALRNGWEIKTDGVPLSEEQKARIEEIDLEFKLKENLAEFNRFKNIFGIRVAIFEVESDEDDYYEKPFNIDGVLAGSYKGISQVDPYWMTPMLTAASTADPASKNFYDPDYWIISGKKYHRSHLVIALGPQPADILKPTYIFGGIPLTQRIYERVYAAERVANEAPLLATNKRTTAIHVDLEKAIANEDTFLRKLLFWVKYRDNHAVKVLGTNETMEQFDTNLSDFDSLIMNQYQLVAAIAKTPATKLLGTSPKGFNATGEFETISYHEELESIQEHVYDPMVNRHYMLLCKSEQMDVQLKVVWNSVDSTSATQLAELNDKKSQTDERYINMGAVAPAEVRDRLRDDPRSGFNFLEKGEADDEPGMSPENLAELEKAAGQKEKDLGQGEHYEAQAQELEGAPKPVGAEPNPLQTVAENATEAPQDDVIEPKPKRAPSKADQLRNLLAELVSKLDDIADVTLPDGKDVEFDDAPGIQRSVKPSVKSGMAGIRGQNSLVEKIDTTKLPRIKIDGIVALIENPRGSIRQAKDGSWRVAMKNHYGFIKGTKGADGDEVDAFIGPNLKSRTVFVVNQVNKSGQFDEHKCMIGFDSEHEASEAYLANFEAGWDGLGSIHSVEWQSFKKWLKQGDTTKPFGGA